MVCAASLGAIATAISADTQYLSIDNQTIFHGISTDSRQVKRGELFVALRGEKFDGHRFVATAIEKGAVAGIVDRQSLSYLQADLPLLVVANTLTAYQQIANWWRKQLTIPIIGITGSAGKTTTKEIIANLLGYFLDQGKEVHKSIANHNNEIGVAQTLLAIDPQLHQFAVLEMAMRGRGQIAELSRMAEPDIGVITNIGTAHIGLLGSQQAIAEAKCELLAEMPQQSTAVLNGDDRLLMENANKVWQGKTILYGLKQGDVHGNLLGNQLTVEDCTWHLPLLGEHNAMNFLAGLAVLRSLNLDWHKIPPNLQIKLPEGRAEICQLGGDIQLLDESYNASPSAVIASLKLLKQLQGQRYWAVLGANRELGELSIELHRQIGRSVAELGIDHLVILDDPEARQIACGLPPNSAVNVYYCSDHQTIVDLLVANLQMGDRILCKASHSVGMDQVVKQLIQHFQDKN